MKYYFTVLSCEIIESTTANLINKTWCKRCINDNIINRQFCLWQLRMQIYFKKMCLLNYDVKTQCT